jgi:hypothetical protein
MQNFEVGGFDYRLDQVEAIFERRKESISFNRALHYG